MQWKKFWKVHLWYFACTNLLIPRLELHQCLWTPVHEGKKRHLHALLFPFVLQALRAKQLKGLKFMRRA